MNHYLNAMRKYATFTGRASRSEFWMFTLIAFLMMVIAAIMDGVIGFDGGALVLTGILSLAHLIPSLSVGVRRLHDIDKSGWWMLLSLIGIGVIILMVFFVLEPTRGPNRFGPAADGSNGSPQGGFDADGRPIHQQAVGGVVAASQAALTADPLDQLNKLKALHDSGAIDGAEFSKMKAELLSKAG